MSDEYIEFELIAYTKPLINEDGSPVLVNAKGNDKVFVGMSADMLDFPLIGSQEFLKSQSIALIDSLNKRSLIE